MPVTFRVATHPAKPVPGFANARTDTKYTARGLFGGAIGRNADKLVQYALSGSEEMTGTSAAKSTPGLRAISLPSGLMSVVLEAYNNHHALALRPDDVWIAIMAQFSCFVSAPDNAERLRAAFVSHSGTRDLVVRTDHLPLVASDDSDGTRLVDLAALSSELVTLVEKNVVDPDLRAWAIPDFSTTTATDQTIGAILLLSTLKSYFNYGGRSSCGIPRVTLLGEKEDWEDLLTRIEKLKEYGIETIAWYHLLRPVLARFVQAFDNPGSKANVDFWERVVHHHKSSGVSFYSGWINAFCVFDAQGRWIGHPLRTDFTARKSPESLSASDFWRIYTKAKGHFPSPNSKHNSPDPALFLDGTQYHILHSHQVPCGHADVDVVLFGSAGPTGAGEGRRVTILAGILAMRVGDMCEYEEWNAGGRGLKAGEGEGDLLEPVPAWVAYDD
ncbi:CBM1 domain-containing protein [Mycena chlorophos]|uniref:CBM1 domain-containing protein n=1 Tax=Mycena chlorophos TaxID=658473 RepID=A0A8H6S2L1_MYCCL|nr:CBM1 domain-containing protein [Mycena chlorophos]